MKFSRSLMILISTLLGVAVFFFKPRKARAPIVDSEKSLYPGTSISIQPGDLLFTPIGKSESKFVGHVGIVNLKHKVVHSIPAGIVEDQVSDYFRKFRSISIFSPKVPIVGRNAAGYLEDLTEKYPRADYRILTPLGSVNHEQYCTKIVWQAYQFGAGVNLGHLRDQARAIHPEFLKDHRHLERKATKL
ncbi:hypothetical protein [Thalassobacillus pellis]|uniref:hypothetical protein n=1 Tax=Thalassobacillus pellis TaxID=748008 RepID=UPI001961CE2B|nr:hypothetical protein [Thalassobacillus pellis]MBM7553253.1 cell wall-associated NlpC family hydrolase [Thalassobacillus pellis]